MSSPAKQQTHTPTLNSLLQQPSAISNQPPPPPSRSASGYGDSSYSPGPMANLDPQPQSDIYYNHRLPVKGSMAGNSSGVPDGRYGVTAPPSPFQQPQIPPHHQAPQQGYYGGHEKIYPSISGYPQAGMANGPSSQSPRTAAPAASQLHGQMKPNSTTNASIPRDHEPVVNGVPSIGKGGPGQTDPPSGPKHPSVAALRQEANAGSPAAMRNASPSPVSLPAPSSPASVMRHSPVSPTPVTVYNQAGAYHGQPTMSGHFAGMPPQHQPPQVPHQQQAPTGFYDGNYQYGGYNHPGGGVHQVPPGPYGVYPVTNGPVPMPGNVSQPYYQNQPPFGTNSGSGVPTHVPQGGYAGADLGPNQQIQPNVFYGQQMKNQINDSRSTNGPSNPYPIGIADNSRVVPSPAVSDSTDAGKDPNRNGSGTPNIDIKHKSATPGGTKSRVNGAKESHPSTPVPASPGCASVEDVDSSLSSPSWPRTPMSPAVKGPSSSSMGPPSALPSGSAGTSGSSKDTGANLIARLLGDPVQLGCTPQEWNERRAFYERLVQYCESNGHPITAQPTVSKQTVDLFRLYMAVRQRGGFEEVTRSKGWKELCHLANLPFTSSASYQLRKHYVRYLLPYECMNDRGGVAVAVVLAGVECKKKSPKNKAQSKEQRPTRDTNHATSVQQPTRHMMQPFPQQSQPQQQQQQQQYSSDQFMGPPSSYSGPTDNSNPPVQPSPSTPSGYPGQPGHYPSGPPYMPMPRGMAPPQPTLAHHQPSGSTDAANNRDSFDDRGPMLQQPPSSYYPPGAPVPMPGPSQSTVSTMGPYGNQSRPGSYSGGHYPVGSSTMDNTMRQSTNNGQSTTPQVGYPSSSAAPLPPPASQPTNTAPMGQSGYSNIMPSPSGSGYQTTAQYQHESSTSTAPPPNQYLSPQPVRYQPPVQVAQSSDPSQPATMISHTYRSNLPPSTPYGPGTYGGPPQSVSSYPPQSQPSENTVSQSGSQVAHGASYSAAPSAESYNSQPGAVYQWPNQRYLHPGQQAVVAQRFGPNAGYPQVVSTPNQSSGDYTRMLRGVPASHSRPNTVMYGSGPPTMGNAYTGVPPNMSLRQDLGMKSLPTGAVQYVQPSVSHSQMAKKELVSPVSSFPPGTVEATTVTLKRRRKLLAKDIGSVEAWRLVMALRSGLQSETTWALNALNILLYDDNSALYFGLTNLPGLLQVLVEHLRRSVMDMLGDLLSIDEVTNSSTEPPASSSKSDLSSCPPDTSKVKSETDHEEERTINIDGNDGVTADFDSRLWQGGSGACTRHLGPRMDIERDEFYLPFARKQPDSEKKTTSVLDGEYPMVSRKRRRVQSGSENTNQFFFGDRQYVESDEVEYHGSSSLYVVPITSSLIVDRCLSVSNAIRGLSFIPGNEVPMSKHAGLLRVLAELLLMCHKHIDRRSAPIAKNEETNVAKNDDTNVAKNEETNGPIKVDTEDSTKLESRVEMEDRLWFSDHLMTIMDDAFVVLCNLSTQLDLYELSAEVTLPLLDSLLHWSVCRSPTANDPLTPWAHVSPHRYAMEILCKLSVQERNVDLVLATPPWERIEFLLELLSTMLMLGEEIMIREFAVVLVHALCSASPVACVAAALKTKALQHLVLFLEQADASMHQIVQNHGMQALRDNPEMIGTSVGMLRRAASSLLFMAKLPSCHPKFNRYQQRLLHFTMSHLMDSRVAATVAETLYELQKGGGGDIGNTGPVRKDDHQQSCSADPLSESSKLDVVDTEQSGHMEVSVVSEDCAKQETKNEPCGNGASSLSNENVPNSPKESAQSDQ